jgi:hypothetical protein
MERTLSEILQGESLKDFLRKCNPEEHEGRGKLDAFRFWAERVFGFDIKWFHLEWVDLLLNNERSCVMAPRQHGKTTILAIAFPLWQCFFYSDKSILIVSDAMHHSTEILAEIRRHIYENELLGILKPVNREQSWTKTKITTSKNCKIICKPYSLRVKGGTYDYVLCDEGSLFSDHDVFFRAICPTVVAKRGNIMVIGTPESELDLLYALKEKALKTDSMYIFKEYKAIDPNGRPLWPEKYTKEHLNKIAENDGMLQFRREYLCELVDESTQAFPPSLLVKSYDIESSFRLEPITSKEYYLGSDLAISPQGDYIVHTLLEREPLTGNLLICDIKRSRGTDYKVQQQDITTIYKHFLPKRVVIDESLFGVVLINDLQREDKVPAEGFRFTPEDRNRIINNLIRLFENGKIKIPRHPNSQITMTMTDQLVKELSDIVVSQTKATGQRTYSTVGKRDDCVMSLAMVAWVADQNQKFLAYVR